MDIFVEQLVNIRKSALVIAEMILLICAAVILCVLLFLWSFNYPVLIFLIVGTIYGAGYLMRFFNIEYEYILTNGTLDFDKIVAKSSRKRVISVECKNIIRAEHINGSLPEADEKFVFADLKSENLSYILVQNGAKRRLVVFEPNNKLIEGIKACAPANISREFFK